MSTTATTLSHRTALHDVAAGHVIWHPITAPEPGFAWGDGGQMPVPETDTLDHLLRVGLIEALPAQNLVDRIEHRRRVELTADGRLALGAA